LAQNLANHDELIGHGWPIKHRKVFGRRTEKGPFSATFQAWSRGKKLKEEFFTTNYAVCREKELKVFLATNDLV
jgi:hypothetical protein